MEDYSKVLSLADAQPELTIYGNVQEIKTDVKDVSIPISYMLYNVLGMVCLYEGQGMRYYVDVYNVITPQKRELTDKLNKMKYIV